MTSRLSLCGEWPPVIRLVSQTEIGVVDAGLVLHQRPDPTSEQTLVQSFIPVVTSQPHVLQYPPHAGLQHLPVAEVQPGAPQTRQDEGSVHGVVPHHVEGQPSVEPLLDGGLLPGGEPAVQVPGHHHVHLGVQDGQEPPQHSEE